MLSRLPLILDVRPLISFTDDEEDYYIINLSAYVVIVVVVDQCFVRIKV